MSYALVLHRERSKQIEEGYANWVRDLVEQGMDPYLMTFLFNPLSGGRARQLQVMRDEMERTYAWLLTRIVRKPRSMVLGPTDRPIWICAPDRPVFKYEKISIREVTVNEGCHFHAIALLPAKSRMDDFVNFIEEYQELLANPRRPMFRVHAKPITETPDKAAKYSLKGVFGDRYDADALFVLPRTLSEIGFKIRFEKREFR